MKCSISGRDVVKEMKSLAEDYFSPGVSCWCIAVKNFSDTGNKRSDKNNNLIAYYAKSGSQGREELRKELKVDNAELVGRLQIIVDNLVKYQSKTHGTDIKKNEPWPTRNCAESNLALFLLNEGKRLSDLTIASYGLVGGAVFYKSLCMNCVQWVRNNFHVLGDYENHT